MICKDTIKYNTKYIDMLKFNKLARSHMCRSSTLSVRCRTALYLFDDTKIRRIN
jgi:hypothetical protein